MNAIIIEASPFDVDQRRLALALLAVSLKRDIARLPNGRWEVIVNLGPSDSLKLYGRTRRDTESAIDEFADMMADPRQALGVYAYFRSLAARAQQELVVLAAAAVRVGKTALRDAYRADPTLDMHEEARQRILKNTGVDPGRKLTKSVGYLTIYGGGPRRLAQVLSIDYNAAVRFQEQYRYAMPEILALDRDLKDRLRRGKTMQTWGGRRYGAQPAENGRTYEYKALNYLVQGSAADITKAAMIRAHASSRPDGGSVELILTVHDQLVALAERGREQEVMKRMREAMEIEFDPPLRTDAKLGVRWGALEKYQEGRGAG